tara:strand:- start:3379 stop:3585 length:207 start_codon:yes stop_codon:yes gene_type:complete
MAEADADFSTDDVSDVSESETGEAAADAAEAYSEAQAEAQRSSLNEVKIIKRTKKSHTHIGYDFDNGF